MTIAFRQVNLELIRTDAEQHLASVSSKIDSFLEDHIARSNHYQILISEEYAGFTSIHGESLIAQHALFPAYRGYGQDIFSQIRRLESVRSAFVPTGDEFFLSHTLDNYRALAKQAYFFAAGADEDVPESPYSLTAASIEDEERIQAATDNFFGDVASQMEKGQLYLAHRDGTLVGCGIMERSLFMQNLASIGMFVIERFRRQGVGAAIIRRLRIECRDRGITQSAGCWYYNHASKKTLERAGMYSQTRLLKVDF